MKIKILLAVLCLAFVVGCKRSAYETAKVTTPETAPHYSVDSNLNGKPVAVKPASESK